VSGQLGVLVTLGGVEGDGLLGGIVAGDLGQGLLQVQHVLGDAVIVVINDLHLNAVQVEVIALGLGVVVLVDPVNGVFLVLAVAVVDVVLGLVVVHGHAGALQVVLHGVLGGGGEVDDVGLVVSGHAQHLGVGQDGGLLHVHGDSLAHVLNRGGHVEGHGLGL